MQALATAVWSVLKAKRRKLLYPDGFISHFYGIMEHLSPVLAWGNAYLSPSFMSGDNFFNSISFFLVINLMATSGRFPRTRLWLEAFLFLLQSKSRFLEFSDWMNLFCTLYFIFFFFFFFSSFCVCWQQEQVEGFLRDIFDFERVRYTTVEDMATDMWALAVQRRQAITKFMTGM